MPTHYFDASDGGPTDPDANWTSDTNAFDGDITTFASGAQSTTSTGFLFAEGTDALIRKEVITQVRARINGVITSNNLNATIYTDNLAESLGQAVVSGIGWGSYTILTAPTGGWDWRKIQALEVKIWVESAGTEQVSRVELLVEVESIPGTISLKQGFS